jgi:hypothetical protein
MARPVPLGALLGAATVMITAACTGADREIEALWSELTVAGEGELFDPASVADLPEPARRYLLRAIAPGTPLARSVELTMRGDIRLSRDGDPVPMVADQVLAPPLGFIWRARTHGGLMRIRGFDRYARGEGAMRWKLFGLIPVVRAEGQDVTRSAAGRLAMEAVLLPSALVPGRGVVWEEVDPDRARFVMTVGDETVATTVEVDPEGRPTRASASRWSDAAGPGYDLFVVELGGELREGGYTVPSEVTAGWRLGGDDEFRFFRALLEEARFR